jgi:hypothetical protein
MLMDEGGRAKVYSVEDEGSIIRLFYFLKTDAPTRLDFRSYEQQGKKVSGNPVSQYRATGVSMWATEDLARLSLSQRSDSVWCFIASIDLTTDGKDLRIERTGQRIGHFTIFSTTDVLFHRPRIVISL